MEFDTLTKQVNELAEILTKNDLAEISVSLGEAKVHIKAKEPNYACLPMPISEGTPAPASPVLAPAKHSGNVITSPIVGTFYMSAAPDKPAFVSVGTKVKKGDVLFIIESMKLMNEITSNFDGTVEEILVSDGQALEFGQEVMVIK